ncbi:hypothetical protein ES705_50094 [subsurface metagenome]
MAGSYFLAKLYRQHNSVVIVVPRPVLVALEVKAGGYVVFKWNQKDGTFEFAKLDLTGGKDADSREHTDSKDRGRATQATVGG